MQDPTLQTYEETASQYAQNSKDLHPHEESKRFLSLLSGDTILDIGCGAGRDAKVFTDRGYKVLGIDYSSAMIDLARNNAPRATFLQADLKTLTLQTTFDGAWANVSLLHLPKSELLPALKNLHTHLSPNAILYIKLKEGTGEHLEPDTRYPSAPHKFYAYYTIPELQTLLPQANFTVLDIYTQSKSHSYHTHPFIHIFSKKTLQ